MSKSLSPRAAELIAELRPLHLREKVLGRRDAEAILVELGRAAEPAVVPELLPFAFGVHATSRAAAAALHRVVTAVAPAELLAIEEACRREWYSADPRRRVRPADVARYAARGEVGVTLAGLCSFHPSGYVREAAVIELSAASAARGGSELPFLLLRNAKYGLDGYALRVFGIVPLFNNALAHRRSGDDRSDPCSSACIRTIRIPYVVDARPAVATP